MRKKRTQIHFRAFNFYINKNRNGTEKYFIKLLMARRKYFVIFYKIFNLMIQKIQTNFCSSKSHTYTLTEKL